MDEYKTEMMLENSAKSELRAKAMQQSKERKGAEMKLRRKDKILFDREMAEIEKDFEL